jgi:chaperonin GroEL
MIKFNDDAKAELQAGINVLADAVQVTLGPGGRNVLILDGNKQHITKDGITVAKNISLNNKFQNLGVNILKETSKKTCDIAGDGSSSVIILTREIINLGLSIINNNHNVIEIKNGMNKALRAMIKYIDKISEKIINKQQLIDVATISANNDVEIGQLIANAFELVNNNGIITVDLSKNTETTVERVEGVKFSNGYLSRFFINDKVKKTADLQNPVIIICKEKLRDIKDIIEPLNNIVKNNDNLLLIVPDIEPDCLDQFINNNIASRLKCCVVKAPGFGDYQFDNIQDLAILTSYKSQHNLYYLGSADRVIVNNTETTIINGHGNKQAITNKLALLQEQLLHEQEPHAITKLQERITRLSNNAAVIHVGALTELEVLEIKDRIDDALNATRAAISEGVVIGGGYAYIQCLEALKDLELKDNEQLGLNIIAHSLTAINNQVLTNAGLEIYNYEFNNQGINAKTGELCDLKQAGIIDPAKVIKTVLENSISTAGIFLTTECAIITEDLTFNQ